MDTIKQQIQALDNAEFANLMRWMYGEEQPRREAQPVVEQAQAEVVKGLQDSGRLPRPEAATEEKAEHGEDIPDWVDPGTDHAQMYQQGDVVRFEGRVVRSTHPGLNHWRPGTLSFDGRIWEDITPTEDAPTEDSEGTTESGEATLSTWRPGVAYLAGEEILYEGRRYRVIQGHTSQADWAPGAADSLFQEV